MGSVVRLFVDKLQNALTGQGTARDPRSASLYAFRAPLTQEELTAAWRGSGLIRKIVSIPALDMVREWREWRARPEEAAAIANEAGVGLLVYYHLSPAPDNFLARRLFASGVNAIRSEGWTIADDGSLYTLPFDSSEIKISRIDD